ncbi:hypothetical protein S40293_09401 [Stachybotrys chartarum IBT 40293]|nr:hypothetical protein S40293_09401 [Stachybotrys chartarum IBT 40293]
MDGRWHNQDSVLVNQGDFHYHLPHRPARAAVRAIPYLRNEDVVRRNDLFDKLNELLPPTTTQYHAAALYSLGGSGKTQIVHADTEAIFIHDYQSIAKQLGIDTNLKKEDVLRAVRSRIESQEKWVLILDNADDLLLFGVGKAGKTTDDVQSINLIEYIPRAPTGTVLWTSRDERVVGTLVGSRHGIQVGPMERNESIELLEGARNTEIQDDQREATELLEELQQLPLAISQAGAYMRRTLTPI